MPRTNKKTAAAKTTKTETRPQQTATKVAPINQQTATKITPNNNQKLGQAIWRQARKFHLGLHTESSAFVRWAIESVYRLQDTDADESVCDGRGDKGIDGIVVDEANEEILILQGKWYAEPGVDQGDGDLKQFMGVRHYFDSPAGIEELVKSKPNQQLHLLLTRKSIKDRIGNGYKTRFVFLTNGTPDASAKSYLQTVNKVDPKLLEILDLRTLGRVAEQEGRPAFLKATRRFDLGTGKWFEEGLSDGVRIVVASIPATDIAKLPGIEDRSLFDMNVRFGLDHRTRVNRELSETIADPREHHNFIAFHNGLTILCESVKLGKNSIQVVNFSVVNGCQSVLALHHHAEHLTPALHVLVRLVEVKDTGPLADKIAYRTNNQNPINMRDLRATDTIQRALREEFHRLFPGKLDYQIRRGEPLRAERSLSNDIAAQILMAFYMLEPWNAVRKLVLFDERYHDIFNDKIRAAHIYLAHLVSTEIETRRSQLNKTLVSGFALTRIVLIYLVGALLEESEEGKEFKKDPLRLLQAAEADVNTATKRIVEYAIDSLNFFFEDQLSQTESQGASYDYKTAFKSRTELEKVRREVVRLFRRDMRREKELAFSLSPRTGKAPAKSRQIMH